MFRQITQQNLNNFNSITTNCKKLLSTTKSFAKSNYDCIIIGAGHNGLVAASYLAAKNLSVCVLEKRHLIGGAAVTEEIIPGFKFSRASYLLSLLRPQIIKDLDLYNHGLKVYLRDPCSYTPLQKPENGYHSLTLSQSLSKTCESIANFSKKDAKIYEKYNSYLDKIASALEPILDNQPFEFQKFINAKSFRDIITEGGKIKPLVKMYRQLGGSVIDFYELLTAPTSKILDRWFESQVLKATLATDSVIGASLSPSSAGSGYVLLHHVMGECNGVKGAWGYVEGGMGTVSKAIASSAISKGVEIFTDAEVLEVKIQNAGATGVVLKGGREIRATKILSNATPFETFTKLVKLEDSDFVSKVKSLDYSSPVTKINLAVSRAPQFTAEMGSKGSKNNDYLRGTIHLNSDNVAMIENAFLDFQQGNFSEKPVIEMTIPSMLDKTIAPKGCHFVQLFTQYTPYLLKGQLWTEEDKKEYLDTVLNSIEMYAPGFRSSVIGSDILTPQDLEETFGLTGGNIFHGAMTLDQLYFMRPVAGFSDYRTPVKGLYLCGSGTHPGGGVMGSSGRLCALNVLADK